MKKITVNFSSSSPDGNIYHILGEVSKAMKKEHRITEFNELRDKVFNSKSYSEALANIRQYIELIDKDGIE